MSGGKLPTTGLALGGTALTLGGYQISWLLAIVIAAVTVVALGFVLFRLGFRRSQPTPATVTGPVQMFGDETAVVPASMLRRRQGARNR